MTRLPPKVNEKLLADFVSKVAPLLMVRGMEALKTFASFIIIIPVFAIITPPLAENVVNHSSDEVVLEVAVLY